MGKSLKTIESSAFANCNSLTSVTIPDSVTSIGRDAFKGCDALREVKSLALVPPTLGSQSCFVVYDQARLLVPQEALAAYNAAQYWQLFTKSLAIEQIGDADGNGVISVSDITVLIDYLMGGGGQLSNELAADCDGNGQLSVADVTMLIDYLLSGSWE